MLHKAHSAPGHLGLHVGEIRRIVGRVLVPVGFLLATVAGTATCRAADSALPPGVALRWGSEPVEHITAHRARMVLNGIWRFAPDLASDGAAPTNEWGFIHVPGTWWDVPFFSGLVVRGRDASWDGFTPARLSQAWIERPFTVPAEWEGRAVLLDLERVGTACDVFVNGGACGSVDSLSGVVDLTDQVFFGAENMLRILVRTAWQRAAFALDGPVPRVEGSGGHELPGLTGDVVLLSRPVDGHIADVYVAAPSDGAEFRVDVELGGWSRTGTVTFAASVLDEAGNEVQRFSTDRSVTGMLQQTSVRLAWPWYRAQRWDLNQPTLYALHLAAEGPDLRDAFTTRFGLRDFRIEGTSFHLNGTPVRLRPWRWQHLAPYDAPSIEKALSGLRAEGYNAVLLPRPEPGAKSRPVPLGLWADAADRQGMLLIAPVPRVGRLTAWWGEIGVRSQWDRLSGDLIRRHRNHPSIVMWSGDGAVFAHRDDQHPRRIGRRARPALPRARGRRATVAEDAVRRIRGHDPARPVVLAGGGPLGDVYAVDHFLNLHPLQERREWLSAWAEAGEMPYMATSFGLPFDLSFSRLRGSSAAERSAEPLITEYAAIYRGEEAYARETAAYRAALADRVLRPPSFRGPAGFRGPDIGSAAPVLDDLQAWFITQTWQTWRTFGAAGGMAPAGLPAGGEGATPSPVRLALRRANRETLAWIAGGGPAWTSRQHHYSSGEPLEKQVVLINDSREPLSFEYTIVVQLDGEKLKTLSDRGRLEVGEIRIDPVALAVPEVTGLAEGRIRLEARVGREAHGDVLDFRAYPRLVRARGTPAVLVHDPGGAMDGRLSSLGIPTETWDGSAQVNRLLIVGRAGLRDTSSLPGDLEAFVLGGGRLVLSPPHPQWLWQHGGFRVSAHVSRRQWPLASQRDHVLLSGIDAVDLHDWRGSGTLRDAYSPLGDPAAGFSDGWRWGNRGSVCSAPVEKPHHTGWTPLIEGEFDLAFASLLELHYGTGLILLNLLDLERSGEGDPAADLLIHQIVNYAQYADVVPRLERVAYLGGPAERVLLEGMGLAFRHVDVIPPNAELLILGPDADPPSTRLERYVKDGGQLLMLGPLETDLPFGVRGRERLLGRYEGTANLEVCPGLSVSDLHTRLDVAARVPVGPDVVPLGNGVVSRMFAGYRGEIWFMALTPLMLDPAVGSYQRYSHWRLTRALAQVLTHLGASFRADRRIFTGDPEDGPLYADGYRTDPEDGDSYTRYYRW